MVVYQIFNFLTFLFFCYRFRYTRTFLDCIVSSVFKIDLSMQSRKNFYSLATQFQAETGF